MLVAATAIDKSELSRSIVRNKQVSGITNYHMQVKGAGSGDLHWCLPHNANSSEILHVLDHHDTMAGYMSFYVLAQ